MSEKPDTNVQEVMDLIARAKDLFNDNEGIGKVSLSIEYLSGVTQSFHNERKKSDPLKIIKKK